MYYIALLKAYQEATGSYRQALQIMILKEYELNYAKKGGEKQ